MKRNTAKLSQETAIHPLGKKKDQISKEWTRKNKNGPFSSKKNWVKFGHLLKGGPGSGLGATPAGVREKKGERMNKKRKRCKEKKTQSLTLGRSLTLEKKKKKMNDRAWGGYAR